MNIKSQNPHDFNKYLKYTVHFMKTICCQSSLFLFISLLHLGYVYVYAYVTGELTYASYKPNFVTEKYLDLILVVKHRVGLTKLRTSSHNLEIERGRYVRPRLKPEPRRCVVCNVMDDEIHFVKPCRISACERRIFYQKMSSADPQYTSLNNKENLFTSCKAMSRKH